MKVDLDKVDRAWIDDLNPTEYYYFTQRQGRIPTHEDLPYCIDYSVRSPKDFVLSGPLGFARGNGRRFSDISSALAWAKARYGEEKVSLLRECQIPQELLDMGITRLTRWSVLVKRR